MRILLMNYEWPPIGGGASPVCLDAAVAMAKLGHTLDVVTMQYGNLPRQEIISDQLTVYRVPCIRRSKEVCKTIEMASYILPAVYKALALHRRRPYEINYTFFIFPTGLAAYLLFKITGLPYVIASHGSDVPGHNPDRFQFQHKLFHPLWKTIARNARHIHVPSPYLLEHLNRLNPGCPTSVIPNGLHGWADCGCHTRNGILGVSRFFEFKGFQYLIEAASLAGLNCPITLVGDGPYRPNLEALARKLGVNVQFTGWLDRNSQEYREHFGSARLFVFPSEKESFGMVLLEAMASGLPCIVAEGGITESLVGEAGLTFRPRDSTSLARAITEILEDPSRCEQLGRSAKKIAGQYDWAVITAEIDRLLKDASFPQYAATPEK